MSDQPQTYKNHTRRDLLFMFSIIVLVINFIFITVQSVRADLIEFNAVTLLWIAAAFALVVIGMKARMYALKAQDRVIRLEERIRYAALLPEPTLAASEKLTVPQIIALRFASDAELPSLVQRAAAEGLTPKQIKESITAWRPDEYRV